MANHWADAGMKATRRNTSTSPMAVTTDPRGRRRVLLASALACALLLVACGSSKSSGSTSGEVLSTAQTKAAIEESILKQRHLHATVTCPTEVVKEKGVTFECIATTSNGAKTTFHVVEVNDLGRVEYSSAPATSTSTTSTTKK
jgi:hypothetical protein